MNIDGKTILVTGASGGIGREIARALAAKGARLIVSGRDHNKLTQLAAQLGDTAVIVSADMGTAEGRSAIVNTCEAEGVDIVVHSAGTLDFALFANQDADAIETMVNLNFLAPVLLSRALVPILEQRPQGAMVFVGSTFGSIGHPGFSVYCATKFGLRGFAESLRRELADTPIQIHYLAPRATTTDLNSDSVVALNHALGNTSDTPQIVAAEVIGMLTSATGRNRYIGWPEKLLVRLNALLPAIVDRALGKKLAIIRRYAQKQPG